MLTVKRLVVVLSAFVLLVQVYRMPVSARETHSEKVDAISELSDEINYFCLHRSATDFMNSFYTRESYEHLTLITLFRYNLISDIVELKREIENNI